MGMEATAFAYFRSASFRPRSTLRSHSNVFWNVRSPFRSRSHDFLPAPLRFFSAHMLWFFSDHGGWTRTFWKYLWYCWGDSPGKLLYKVKQFRTVKPEILLHDVNIFTLHEIPQHMISTRSGILRYNGVGACIGIWKMIISRPNIFELSWVDLF